MYVFTQALLISRSKTNSSHHKSRNQTRIGLEVWLCSAMPILFEAVLFYALGCCSWLIHVFKAKKKSKIPRNQEWIIKWNANLLSRLEISNLDYEPCLKPDWSQKLQCNEIWFQINCHSLGADAYFDLGLDCAYWCVSRHDGLGF